MSETKGRRQKGSESTSRKQTSQPDFTPDAEPKLSTPANMLRVLDLLINGTQTQTELYDWIGDLLSETGTTPSVEQTLLLSLPNAARIVEQKMSARRPTKNPPGYDYAQRAYKMIQDILNRTSAGETLDEIKRDRDAKMRERSEEAARNELAKPEPKNKQSDEWREWKLRQWEAAFKQETPDQQKYAEAWAEFRALLDGLIVDGDFWRTSNALALAPALLRARQDIDRVNAEVSRDRKRAARRKEAKKG